MAARKESRLKTQHRQAIQTSMIRKRLEDHISSPQDNPLLSPSQVTAALGLLKKTMPDLAATELDATIQDKTVKTMTDAELYAIAGGK